ncbi:MAG: hypothetical protein M0Q93_00430 [Terrimicrobiaceae bacterium]|nr:hypothetical protein [Terrimicrobiaceae bacterium]
MNILAEALAANIAAGVTRYKTNEMKSIKLPEITEVLIHLLQTRVESARVDLGLARDHLDIQLVRDRCNCALEDTIRCVATLASPGIQHEALTFKALKNSWNHFLRDLSFILPRKLEAWLASKVKYSEVKVACTDLWPRMELPERHGDMLRTVSCAQWSTLEETPGNGIKFVQKPFTSLIEL